MLETACYVQGTGLMLQPIQLHLLPAGKEQTGYLRGRLWWAKCFIVQTHQATQAGWTAQHLFCEGKAATRVHADLAV